MHRMGPPKGEDPPRDVAPSPPGQAEAPPAASAEPDEKASSPKRSRYRIAARGEEAAITCGNASSISLHVERGLVVDEAARKKYPPRTIFLDGVFDGPPFYDNKTRQYSLDHHAGCIRSFMLATCEQAVVVVLQGLDLGEGSWHVYVNEPDLDSLLAAWVILNHVELLRAEAEVLRHAMPLIRTEGVIDGHGLDMEVLTALSREAYAHERRRIDLLLERERLLKSSGEWASLDLLAYSKEMLERIDGLLFPPQILEKLLDVEEVSRVALQGQKLAVLCRSHQSIYDVEAQLKDRYDRQLAIIVLDLGGGRFTLRLSDPFLDKDLGELYERLNALEMIPEPKDVPENRWGGAGDIGGSPRKIGSTLSGETILEAVQDVYGRGTWLGRLIDKLRGS
jgi:hypothetical protein